MKSFCQIHHLYYNGRECPLCLSERIERYNKKFNKKDNKKLVTAQQEKRVTAQKDREITQDDLNNLIKKFNR